MNGNFQGLWLHELWAHADCSYVDCISNNMEDDTPDACTSFKCSEACSFEYAHPYDDSMYNSIPYPCGTHQERDCCDVAVGHLKMPTTTNNYRYCWYTRLRIKNRTFHIYATRCAMQSIKPKCPWSFWNNCMGSMLGTSWHWWTDAIYFYSMTLIEAESAPNIHMLQGRFEQRLWFRWCWLLCGDHSIMSMWRYDSSGGNRTGQKPCSPTWALKKVWGAYVWVQ